MAQLVPEAKDKLAKFKNQVSTEMGVPFTDYWSYVNILDTKSQTFLCCTSS